MGSGWLSAGATGSACSDWSLSAAGSGAGSTCSWDDLWSDRACSASILACMAVRIAEAVAFLLSRVACSSVSASATACSSLRCSALAFSCSARG